MEPVKAFATLRQQVLSSADEHNKYGSWDALLYNSATIIAIVLTSLAALLPIEVKYLKIISGLSAILIVLDRTLSWGARWIYHRQMRQEYLIIEGKISFYENMPGTFTDEEKKKQYLEIYSELFNVRRKEVAIPGSKAG